MRNDKNIDLFDVYYSYIGDFELYINTIKLRLPNDKDNDLQPISYLEGSPDEMENIMKDLTKFDLFSELCIYNTSYSSNKKIAFSTSFTAKENSYLIQKFKETNPTNWKSIKSFTDEFGLLYDANQHYMKVIDFYSLHYIFSFINRLFTLIQKLQISQSEIDYVELVIFFLNFLFVIPNYNQKYRLHSLINNPITKHNIIDDIYTPFASWYQRKTQNNDFINTFKDDEQNTSASTTTDSTSENTFNKYITFVLSFIGLYRRSGILNILPLSNYFNDYYKKNPFLDYSAEKGFYLKKDFELQKTMYKFQELQKHTIFFLYNIGCSMINTFLNQISPSIALNISIDADKNVLTGFQNENHDKLYGFWNIHSMLDLLYLDLFYQYTEYTKFQFCAMEGCTEYVKAPNRKYCCEEHAVRQRQRNRRAKLKILKKS